MSDCNSFEYDVAFSFLARDEAVATQINDLLQSRVRTFLYSEQQKALAGRDGEEVFTRVFAEKARFVAVLYGQGWGETPWTRVEETAIKNRIWQEGHDFLLVIPTGDTPTTPKWLPKNRLWIGLNRWGIQGAAAVIEQRVQELGGEPAEESVADRAARLSRARAFAQKQKEFSDTEAGVKAANAAAQKLKDRITELANDISKSDGSFHLQTANVHGEYILHGLGPFLVISWVCHWANTLQDAYLQIEFCNRLPMHLQRIPSGDHTTLDKSKLLFELVAPNEQKWIAPSNWKRKELDSTELAEMLMKKYLDVAEHWAKRANA